MLTPGAAAAFTVNPGATAAQIAAAGTSRAVTGRELAALQTAGRATRIPGPHSSRGGNGRSATADAAGPSAATGSEANSAAEAMADTGTPAGPLREATPRAPGPAKTAPTTAKSRVAGYLDMFDPAGTVQHPGMPEPLRGTAIGAFITAALASVPDLSRSSALPRRPRPCWLPRRTPHHSARRRRR